MATGQGQRLGLIQGILLALIAVYRVSLAYVMGGRCRFYPSCSVYGQQAIRAHGATRGSYLTARRILRCHPWHPGGVDPVPEPRMQVQS